MKELKHNCFSCLYRHGGCHEYLIVNNFDFDEECPNWEVGLCYGCKFYGKYVDEDGSMIIVEERDK